MKKLLLLMISLLGFITANAALTALHIHTTTRGVVTVLLDDEPVIKFNNNRSITVEVPGKPGEEPIRLDFDEIETCEYGDKNDYNTGADNDITADTGSNITVRMDAGGVTFSNIPDESRVEVYTLGGARVLNAPAQDNSYYLDRSSLSHGVYIVRIGVFVTKLSL